MKKQKANQNTKDNGSSLLIKIIFGLAILFVYGQTLKAGFVLDDDLYIVKNPIIQKGISEIPNTFLHGISEHFKGSNFMGYRPVTISFFVLQNAMFGLNASAFHLMNIILYFLIALQLFRFLKSIIPDTHVYYAAGIVLLFILHPIHTEVVANIKSQDELLSALFSLLAFNFYILWNQKKSLKDIIISSICFLLALFSKESSIAYLILFPALLWLIFNESISKSLIKSSSFFIAGILFLIIRSVALSDVVQGYETSPRENILYAAHGWNEVAGTKLSILFYYFIKSVFPYSLSWDYSFNQIPVVSITSVTPIVSLLVIGLLLFLFFKLLKSKPVISFGILLFASLLAPTCNLFILNGTTFGERFLFMPIAGITIMVLIGLLHFFKMDYSLSPFKSHKNFTYSALVIMALFFYQSAVRASEWNNNLVLFKSGVKDSPNSARTNVAYATELMNMAEKELSPQIRNTLVDSALFYFDKTVQIDTAFSDAWYKIGLIHAIKSENEKAIENYKKAIQFNDKNIFALNNLAALYASQQKPDSAYIYFVKSYNAEPVNDMTLTNLTVICNILNKNDETIRYGKEAIQNNFINQKVYFNMSSAYSKLNKTEEANQYLQLANGIK